MLGQSFGGFCTVSYLSFAPHGMAGALITGGLPGLDAHAEDVYRLTYATVAARRRRALRALPRRRRVRPRGRRAPGHPRRAAAGRVAADRRAVPVDRRHARRQSAGSHELHYLLEDPWDGDGGLSDAFLADVADRTGFARAPLYAVLHEACYAQGDGDPVGGAPGPRRVPRVRPGGRGRRATRRCCSPGRWSTRGCSTSTRRCAPLRDAAELLAERDGWPPLYDPARLAANEVPAAAAVYHDDMYVPAPLSLRTAAGIRGLRAWVTNEWEHEGLRVSGGKVLGRLIAMNRGEV